MWNHHHSLLDLHDSLFGSLATYLCADTLLFWNQPSNFIAAYQTIAAQSQSCQQTQTIPKLDGTNYCQWSFHITAGLQTLDLWLVTEAVTPLYQVRPVPAAIGAPIPEKCTREAAWDSANERSIGFMSRSMEEAIAHYVHDAATAAAGAAQVTA